MNDLVFHPILDVPQELLLELAVGVDSFDDICERYEYNREQAEQLLADPGVKARVSRIAADLKKEGITIKMRAAHAAEDLVGDIWRTAKRSDTSLQLKIEAAKLLAKLGDVEPKTNLQAQAGPGFSVTINIPQVGEQPKRVIDIGGNVVDASTVKDKPGLNLPTFGKPAKETKNAALELPEDWEA